MGSRGLAGFALFAAVGLIGLPALARADTLLYISLAQPCRLLDTRSPGPGALTSAHGAYLLGSRDADIESASQHGNSAGCGIPTNASAVTVNFNMFNSTASGNILTWASDGTKPTAGTAVYNAASSQVIYNGASATLAVGSADGKFNLSVANGQLDMTINVTGYWYATSIGADATGYGAIEWGEANDVSGKYSAAGGFLNVVRGGSSLAIGNDNTISAGPGVAIGSENTVSASLAVAIGYFNTADAQYAIALGNEAFSNQHTHSFVFCDGAASTVNTANNQFMARASGGVIFYTGTDTSTGAKLAAGSGTWTALSDRNAKTAVQQIDGRDVLDRVVAMPLATWQYKTQDAKYRHMGPMAQDFYAAFGLGESDTGIDTIDADGVALAAIQGLNAKLEAERSEHADALAERDRQIAELRAQVAELAAAVRHPAGAASP